MTLNCSKMLSACFKGASEGRGHGGISPITPEVSSWDAAILRSPDSVDGTVSCARCHQAALYGTDGFAKGEGARFDKLK